MDAIAARIAAAPNVLAVRVIILSLAETGADKKSCRSISALNKPSAAHPVPGVVLLLPNCGSAVTVLAVRSGVTACAAYSVSSPRKLDPVNTDERIEPYQLMSWTAGSPLPFAETTAT